MPLLSPKAQPTKEQRMQEHRKRLPSGLLETGAGTSPYCLNFPSHFVTSIKTVLPVSKEQLCLFFLIKLRQASFSIPYEIVTQNEGILYHFFRSHELLVLLPAYLLKITKKINSRHVWSYSASFTFSTVSVPAPGTSW